MKITVLRTRRRLGVWHGNNRYGFTLIYTKLNPNPADITGVMGNIGKLLDASITGVDMPAKPAPVMDLSKIDFHALAAKFKESKHQNIDLEVLKAAIRAQLEKLIRLNKTRTDFTETFEELIENYNADSRKIEELFEELLKLSRNLSAEQQRHVRENMSEEELVIFDILTRPAPELSTDERAEVKKVARDLLNRLKQLLVLNWRQKSSARSQLQLAIEDVLDTGLPRVYDKPLYEQKCSALFEHIYESYPERDAGVYKRVLVLTTPPVARRAPAAHSEKGVSLPRRLPRVCILNKRMVRPVSEETALGLRIILGFYTANDFTKDEESGAYPASPKR